MLTMFLSALRLFIRFARRNSITGAVLIFLSQSGLQNALWYAFNATVCLLVLALVTVLAEAFIRKYGGQNS